jgi:SAM-dependent methyltransferase
MDDTFSLEDIPLLDRVSIEAQHEKTRYIGHISALHPWWARLPLVVARAAMYTALTQERAQDSSLLDELCVYPGAPEAIHTARSRILQIHTDGLLQEIRPAETVEDIEAGRLSRPRVLDLFSGSGTIPLEALRLGCNAFAIDLNPVAYLIQLCALYYPQRFGEPTSESRGSAPDGTWAGLPAEVRFWSRWVHEQVEAEIGDLYSPISLTGDKSNEASTPTAYLWARTVSCNNTACGATVPLVRQAWLARKRGRYVALRPELDPVAHQVRYHVVESDTKKELGFEPTPTVLRGEASCPFCNVRLSRDYIRNEGRSGRLGKQLLAVVCLSRQRQRVYLAGQMAEAAISTDAEICQRIQRLCRQTGLMTPQERLPDDPAFRITRYGLARYQDLFTARQLLTLLTYAKYIHSAHGQMHSQRIAAERAKATATYLGLLLDHLANANSTLCSWQPQTQRIMPTFVRASLPMTWDFAELCPFVDSSEMPHTGRVTAAVEQCIGTGLPAEVLCASATQLPFEDGFFDAIVTDAPYYDNIAYADLSDFFYVWLNRSIGHLYPDQFDSAVTAKEDEVIVAPQRHGNDQQAADLAYEQMMEAALAEAARVLRPGRLLTLLVHSPRPDVLQRFLDLAQRADLELFDAERIELKRPFLKRDEGPRYHQILLTFKRSKFIRGMPQASADPETVLRLADAGKPTLYAGLAEFLLDRISQECLASCIPLDYKGPFEVRLKEYIADCENPGQLLEELLGRPGIIGGAADLGLMACPSEADYVAARDQILRSYGFNVPEPLKEGVTAAIGRIEELVPRVQTARNKLDLRGILPTVMNLLEDVLYKAALAWSYAIFGESKEEHLREIVEGKSLDLLTMGDVKRVFCELPNYVAQRSGRPHPYKPRKFVKHLDALVELRNKVEHNKEDYLDVTPLASMREEFAGGLNRARHTLVGLRDSGALPLIVKPIRESTDMYGRCSVELWVEDGTTREIYVTHPLQLGRNYVFFRPESNPRPLDPPMFLLSDVLDTGN